MFRLAFTIHGNPDRNQGDWMEDHTLSASDMDSLRSLVHEFQSENNIGGGNWGVAVLLKEDEEGSFVKIGYMSYNGRVWKDLNWKPQTEEVFL
jgi:hypothetical protein